MMVVFAEDCVTFNKAMVSVKADDSTVWAHTHPYWEKMFGVYIVRKGRKIIYTGRDLNQVGILLGVRS